MRFSCLLAALVLGCAAETTPPGPGSTDGDWCHGKADGTTCDDGNSCTRDDVCGLGVCRGRPIPEGDACNDGAACTVTDQCAEGLCVGQALDCAADPDACAAAECTPPVIECDCVAPTSPCLVASCDTVTGQCSETPAGDGASCDDGNPCTENDACGVGSSCAGTPKACEGSGPCHSATCDPATGACQVAQHADGTACDDGNPCSSGETCSFGACGGATFAPNGTACDDGDACTENTACAAGGCLGTPVGCGQLDTPCALGSCDPASGACVATPREDGLACDDGDDCTSGDQCQAGACTGVDQCPCRGQPDGVACDDGRGCSTDDACLAQVCAGTEKDCTTLDGPCELGVCDEATLGCVSAPRPHGTPCNDDDPCTTLDACRYGTCRGAPKDCSGLATDCLYGACEAGTGACVPLPVAEETPCDDGDPCTGHDRCEAGACEGPLDVCAPCAGNPELPGLSPEGGPCDDGDPCTLDSTCQQQGPALVCRGTSPECAPGSECQLTYCDLESGACGLLPRPNGAVCSDGNNCTELDRCTLGSCNGDAVTLCGAPPPDDCEAVADQNGLPEGALPIGITLNSGDSSPNYAKATIVVWTDAPGEVEWFAVALRAGEQLSVETRPHCGSTLDTTIAAYRLDAWDPGEPMALSVLDAVDQVGASTWAALGPIEAVEDMVLLLEVGTWSDSGVGSYLLDVALSLPPPCGANSDCGCSDLACEAGACVSKFPTEDEVNDSGETATAVTGFGQLRGAFDSPGDEDWFALPVVGGVPLTVSTRPTCGEVVDPAIELRDSAGELLASDLDNGGAGQAWIGDFVPKISDVVFVRVTNQSGTLGPYVVSIVPGGCLEDADCGCAEQQCTVGSGAVGECQPKLTTPEPSEPLLPTSLAYGERRHGRIDSAFDVDSFSIGLGTGSWRVRTAPYCGSEVDTTLAITDVLGEPLVVSDDEGTGFFAEAVVTLAEAASVRIDVAAEGAGTGEYVVEVVEEP